MIVTIEEMEMREAVVEWLEKHHGLSIGPMELTPKMDVESDYEHSASTMVGFTFKATSLNLPKGDK